MRDKLYKLAEEYFDDIVKTASELIQIPSMSGEEDKVAAYTEKKMNDLGYDQVTVDKYGNVIGLVKGTGGGKSIMLNCHLDTVDEGPHDEWKYPPFSGEVAEGKIWGRGASDTKGTFAIYLYAPYLLKKLDLLPAGDIYVVGVIHEEDAGYGSMKMAEDGFKTDYAIVGEATENDIAIGCRGRAAIDVMIRGTSCHASMPHEGNNPFDLLGPFLVALKEIEPNVDPLFGPSSITPTKIESSEAGTNVIPNWLHLSLDYRSVPGETNKETVDMLQKIADDLNIEGITVEVEESTIPVPCYTGHMGEGFSGEPPFSIDPSGDTVIKAKAALEQVFDREVKTKPWAFATDSGHFSQVGVEVIGFSPAEIVKCHTVEDNIRLDMLKDGIVGTLTLIDALIG